MQNISLVSNSVFNITISDIVVVLLLTAVIFIIRKFSFQLINKISETEKRKLLKQFSNMLLLLIVLFGASAMIFSEFFKMQLFRTDYFYLKTPYIFYLIFITIFSFFSSKFLEKLLKKSKSGDTNKLEVKRKGILLIKYLIWLIALSLALKIILLEPSKPANFELIKIKNIGISVFDLIFLSIIFSVTGLSLLGLKKYFQHQSETSKIDPGNASALFKIIKYIVWVLAIIVGLQSAGFNISLILAGSAALLVGFGIGVQNIFADIVSGFILLLERPLKATDIIEVDGIIGKVKNIGIRTTTLYTRDDTIIRVPNSKFTSEKIVNWSDLKFNTRFNVGVGVAYGSDVPLVMKCMKRSVVNHEQVDKYPEPFVRFENFGDSSLDFSVFFWSSENMGIENIKSDIRVAIDNEFREHNISIPFPQRDVHIIKSD